MLATDSSSAVSFVAGSAVSFSASWLFSRFSVSGFCDSSRASNCKINQEIKKRRTDDIPEMVLRAKMKYRGKVRTLLDFCLRDFIFCSES